MALNNRVWSAFCARWGPAIMRTSWAVVPTVRALVLVGLGLVGDLVVILNGLVYVVTCIVNVLEHILDLLE